MLASVTRRSACAALRSAATTLRATSFTTDSASAASSSLGPGDSLLGIELQKARKWDKAVSDGFRVTTGEELFKGQKVVVVGVPGAFTGVCSQSHIPGYINALPELRELGVERLLCVSVNDPYTMCAWSNKMGLTEPSAGNWGLWMCFYGDVDGAMARALGVETDLRAAGLGPGMRSNRFSLFVNDGSIVKKNVEKSAGELSVTDAATMVAQLKKCRKTNPNMSYRGDI